MAMMSNLQIYNKHTLEILTILNQRGFTVKLVGSQKGYYWRQLYLRFLLMQMGQKNQEFFAFMTFSEHYSYCLNWGWAYYWRLPHLNVRWDAVCWGFVDYGFLNLLVSQGCEDELWIILCNYLVNRRVLREREQYIKCRLKVAVIWGGVCA